jgi:hypothetical protein
MIWKFVLPAVLCMILSSCILAQDKADMVLLNGKIYTANDLDQFAQAVAIKDSLILSRFKHPYPHLCRRTYRYL